MIFYINQYIVNFVPKYNFRETTFPLWFTKELKYIVHMMKIAYTKFKLSPKSECYIDYTENSRFNALNFNIKPKGHIFSCHIKHIELSLRLGHTNFEDMINFHKNISKEVSSL